MDAFAFHAPENDGIGTDVLTPDCLYERTILASDDERKGAYCSRTVARRE